MSDNPYESPHAVGRKTRSNRRPLFSFGFKVVISLIVLYVVVGYLMSAFAVRR